MAIEIAFVYISLEVVQSQTMSSIADVQSIADVDKCPVRQRAADVPLQRSLCQPGHVWHTKRTSFTLSLHLAYKR